MSPKKIGKTWYRFIGRLCILMVIVGGGLIAPLSAQAATASLTVNMSTVIQNDFLGVTAVYHGFAFMPEQINKGMNDTDRAREFDRVQRIGLNIARTWYHPNYACTTTDGLWGACDWNSTRMQALYSWLQAMKDRNVDVALQLGWWFTRDTYYGHTGPDANNDPAKFAAWVSESLYQIITVKGFTNVKYGILFTEPTAYESGTVPSGYSQWTYYVKMVKAIHDKLVADGRRSLVKLVGPNNSSGAAQLSNAVSDLNSQIDIYSGHDYNYADYSGWSNLCNNMKNTVSATGKPFWLDEWGKQDEAYRQTADYGNYVAQGVAACLNAGVQTPMSWILFDQQYISVDSTVGNTWNGSDSFYNGVHRWGFAKWPRDTIANPTYPYPSWYAFSLLSKYLGGRGGTQVYQTSSANGVYIAAVKRPTNDWSFLVVNTNASTTNIQVALSSALNRTLYRYLYNPAQITPTEAADLIAADIQLPNVGTGFSDILPARGVAIYSTIGSGNPPTPTVAPTPTPCPGADPDLLAWWKVNNAGGDASCNDHNLTLQGGASYATDAKEGSHSLSLNGSDGFADATVIDLGNNFTIAAWVKIPARSSIQTILANTSGGGTSNGFKLFVNTWNTSDRAVTFETGNGSSQANASTAVNAVPVDTWTHVAVTINRGAGSAKIYVNGINATASGAIRTDFQVNAGTNLGRMTNSAYYFGGSLDDIRLYRRELNAAEVSALAGGSSVTPTNTPQATNTPQPTQTPSPTPTSTNDLLARWQFNNNANDSSGNGRNATLYNGANYATDNKEGGYALNLDGSNDYAGTPAINLGNQFTIVTWVKIPGGRSSIQTMMANAAGGCNTNGFRLMVNTWNTSDQVIKFETGNGSTCAAVSTAAGVFAWNQWNMVAVVVDRAAGTGQIFYNGSDVTSGNAVLTNFANTAALNLGRFTDGNWLMQGQLDDVRLYNRKLSAAEIAALYGSPVPTATSTPLPTATNTPLPTNTPTPAATATPSGFLDTFSAGDSNWNKDSGTWAVESGEYSQSNMVDVKVSSLKNATYGNATFEFDMKIVDGTSDNWAGIQIRKSVASATPWGVDGGYLIYFRKNGAVGLYRAGTGLAEVNTGLDFSTWRHVKIVASGSNFKIYVNNGTTPVIDQNDSNLATGYVSLVTYYTHTHFDNVNVR